MRSSGPRPNRPAPTARWARLAPRRFRQLAVVSAYLLGVIVVTGATVRLTSSGLGCSTWPKCTATSVVAPAQYHALVEFSNRMLTVLVGIVVGLVALGSLVRAPRRRDLAWLSWSLVAGFCAQAVIGGLSVLYDLAPVFVVAHFLVSMLLVWAAIVLVHRAHPAWSPAPPTARIELLWLGRVLVIVAGGVLCLGTLTTGTGPHAGSGDHVRRLHLLTMQQMTQLHADSALLLTGLILATVFTVRLTATPAAVRRRSNWLVVAVLSQVAIGYTQYFLGLPASVVEIHVAGATVLWSVALWMQLGYTAPAVPPLPSSPAASGRQPVVADRAGEAAAPLPAFSHAAPPGGR